MAGKDDEEERLRVAALQNAQSILLARRRAEEALRKQSEWLRITLASIGDAVVSTDAEGRVTFMNGVAEVLTGWTQAETAGRPLVDIFHIVNEHTRQPVENPALRALREGTIVGLANHTVLVARDGTERPIDDSAAPIRDGAGASVGAVLVFRDVTERKRAEQAQAERGRLAALRADVALALASGHGLQQVLQHTAEAFVQHLDAAFARVWTLDDAAGVLVLQASAGLYTHLDGPHGRVRVGEYKIGRIAQSQQPHLTNAVATDPNISNPDWARQEGMVAFAGYPLVVEARVVGVLALFARHTLSDTVLADLAPLADAVAQCIERKRNEQALRESEARYRAIVESTPECVWLIGPDGTLLQMNPAGLVMVAADEAEVVLGQCVYSLIAPEYRDTFRAFNERVCRGSRGSLGFEIVGLRGIRRHMETAAVPLATPQGGFNHLAVTRDVTERVAAERELRESEERYRQAAAAAAQVARANAKFRAFFEQGTNFAGVLSLDGTVIEANRLWLEAGGFTRAEVIGKPFWECGWWNRSLVLMDMVRSACQEAVAGRLFRTETSYFVAGGDERVVDFSLAPVTDEAGHVLFLAATGADITERRQMEDALREADRKKDDFIALLAHELRNPLAPLRNGLQVIRLTGANATAVAQARAMMERQLGHMVRLIDDLLDISRINRNKMELRRSRILLADVVNSAVETVRPAIEAAGHELTVSLPQGQIFLDADLTRLAQVFSNLLTNSAKYTEHGGRIWLTAERWGAEVVVSVRDTGIGIPPESLPRIFDMFSQVDRSIERSTGGLGIGLALVKGLVEMHGGRVQAASPGQGKGSTFTIKLPALETPAEPLAAMPSDDGQTASGPKRRLLVVDDNRDSAISMALMLELMGNEVCTAHDGVEAVAAAEAFRPQVILMDVGMPRLNGLDATQRIRAQPWGQSMVIIALTGWGQEGDKVRSHQAGCDGHLVKPVYLPDLENLLAELTQQTRESQ